MAPITVTYAATDVTQAPSSTAMMIELGGVTNGVWAPIQGWAPDGQIIDSTVMRVLGGAGSVTLIPNAAITPANTVYRIHPQENPRLAQYIIVPATGGPYTVQDLLTAQPAQPDTTVQGAMLSMVDNGDGTTTVTASGVASVVDNGDGTSTLTLGG